MSDERTHWHVGWPVDEEKALEQIKRGLKPYWPTDPKPSRQDIYVEWAKKRGPNSE